MRRWWLLAMCFLLACGDNGRPGADAAPAVVAVTDPSGHSVTQLDLGTLPIGATGSAIVLVTNASTGPTAPLQLAISGADASDFTIDPAKTSCAGATLVPGQTCTVRTSGQPNDASYSGTQLVIGGDFCATQPCGGFVQALAP